MQRRNPSAVVLVALASLATACTGEPPREAAPPETQADTQPATSNPAANAAAADLPAALVSARHGAELIAAGFAADIEYCARLDASTTVPLLHRDGDGLLALRALTNTAE